MHIEKTSKQVTEIHKVYEQEKNVFVLGALFSTVSFARSDLERYIFARSDIYFPTLSQFASLNEPNRFE